MLTQGELKKQLHYNSSDGVFTRLRTFSGVKAGDVAGSISNGYAMINVLSKLYPAHRLAWLYVYGEWPKNQIDHINHIRDDNRIINLRDVTHQENHKNKKQQCNNASGVTGVYWNKVCEKWQSSVSVEGKLLHLGYFTDKFEAICARKSAETKYGYHNNHGNKI